MTLVVHLTSFKRWHESIKHLHPNDTAVSIAMYQPKWFPPLPDLGLFKIDDGDGNWIRPREFLKEHHDPTKPDLAVLGLYKNALAERWDKQIEDIKGFIAAYNDDRIEHHVYFCCWCPYDRAAKRQLRQFGSFVCHSAVVGWYLRNKVQDVKVYRDKDRKNMVRFD